METIKITIDNKQVEVEKGTTILGAARKLGIDIPTLCHMRLDDLNIENKPGGCRICVVEVQGRRNLSPACITKCDEGTVIRIHHPRGVSANDSAFITFRDTGGRQVPASLNFHDTNPAAARLVFYIQIVKSHVAQGGDINPHLACGTENGGSLLDFYLFVVYCDLYCFHCQSSLSLVD